MLHRRFPQRKLSLYHLRQVYRQHMIRKKKIKRTKLVTLDQRAKIHAEALEAKAQLNALKLQGHRIIYVDEFVTTKSTLPTHAWSLKRKPLQIDLKQFSPGCLATIIGISAEAGVELVKHFDRSVDRPKFIEYLKALRRKHRQDRLAIFVDQLSVHKSLDVAAELAKQRIEMVLNAAYSPDYNPIEGAIGVAKAAIKKERLRRVLLNEADAVEEIVDEACK